MLKRAAALAGVLILVSAGAATASMDDHKLIVGGTLASTTEAPWAIALLNTNSARPTGRWCGAALVRPNKIITAAHCMIKPASTYRAVQGRADLNDTEAGRTSGISSIWIHPGYNRTNNQHDFAILTLARPFKGVPVIKRFRWRRTRRPTGGARYRRSSAGVTPRTPARTTYCRNWRRPISAMRSA
jgi:secreted trypsin-like serine protease